MEVNVQNTCVRVFTQDEAINLQPLVVLTQDLSGVAQQDTLVQGITDIRTDISGISIDTSTLAQRTDVKDGNDTAVGVAKELRSEVGTGSDTAAESGTLFAVVKWVKDKVKSIFQLIGSPASGQPSTLFAAIAAGGGGGGGDAQESTSQSILAAVQSIIDTHIINTQSLDGMYTFKEGTIIDETPGSLLAAYQNLVRIDDPILEHMYASFPNGLGYLTYMRMANANMIPSLYHDGVLLECIFPKATSVNGNMDATKLQVLDISSMRTGSSNGPNIYQCHDLVDVIAGVNFADTEKTLIFWNPTNALNASLNTLVKDSEDEFGNPITNNLQQLMYNIRRHIVANLTTAGGTLVLQSVLKNAINADQTTADAFTNKNWTIA